MMEWYPVSCGAGHTTSFFQSQEAYPEDNSFSISCTFWSILDPCNHHLNVFKSFLSQKQKLNQTQTANLSPNSRSSNFPIPQYFSHFQELCKLSVSSSLSTRQFLIQLMSCDSFGRKLLNAQLNVTFLKMKIYFLV